MPVKFTLKEKPFKQHDRKSEIFAILLLAFSVFICISLITFNSGDLPLFSSQINQPINNFAGIIGAYVAGFLMFFMGLSAYIISILALFWAIAGFAGRKSQKIYLKIFGTFFLILAVSSTFSLLAGGDEVFRFRMGGFLGLSFSNFLMKYLGTVGAAVAIIVLLLLSVLVATDFLIFPFIIFLWKTPTRVLSSIRRFFASRKRLRPKPKPKTFSITPKFQKAEPKQSIAIEKKEPSVNKNVIPVKEITKPKSKEEPVKIEPKELQQPKPYTLPALDLFKSPPPIEEREIEDNLTLNSKILEDTLADFGIEAKVIEVNKGPVITRYELEPASGIKVHRITSLGDNIALSMKAESVRIVAPVPGKGTIGIELPNSKSSLVYLKEVLDTKEYSRERSKLKLALGKNISGDPVIGDLAKMPHLLIAGATGSGKTVCVNSIIASLLFNCTPEDVKFIMVDPKKVELAQFNNLPHLLCPVVTDHKKVPSVLEWVLDEMDRRFALFSRVGVRNIDIYNEKGKKEKWEPLYFIILIIDELADLMQVSKDEVESAIHRLAALARATGIHLILATQRPSVDVITGVIKANFSARISFKVASKVDSRTVLDINGADKLLGMGDMLFVEPGEDKPLRAQGSLVFDDEIERLSAFIKGQRNPEYVEELMKSPKKKSSGGRFQRNEIYEEAVRIVLKTKQASVSMVQRKLGVGYTKAARIIDMMEEDGIVGPYQGSKPREILVDSPEASEESIS
ncbi:MAG: DNA translocase FtsK [Candidatus Omnitrophica bacterium]|nr:DNA translocase FtsK [Candidatus Omnitrophota bacterium]